MNLNNFTLYYTYTHVHTHTHATKSMTQLLHSTNHCFILASWHTHHSILRFPFQEQQMLSQNTLGGEDLSSTFRSVLQILPDVNEFLVMGGCGVCFDGTITRLPKHSRLSITAASSSSSTLLKIIFQAPRGTIVNDGVHVMKIDSHPKSHCSEHHSNHTFRIS